MLIRFSLLVRERIEYVLLVWFDAGGTIESSSGESRFWGRGVGRRSRIGRGVEDRTGFCLWKSSFLGLHYWTLFFFFS